ncbi:glycosyltransferase [Evansella cellulosilytica]|uniref:Glycosyl transferase family 2 n=1 Tax=Evansella cellulosilytica (strain ATCC 21833 / DSM 2522 / FERM P-1141 / JCM 9156 / N-4) TaxID=649639 RepID=E6TWC7_EVAC2|nr:glycosyltransferase [Evansella cellulosilytica]ADU31083.1 glycosyl transferase family 2 [Evansella cellulosilytica DSM 2522]
MNVSVITCTMREDCMENMIRNFLHQTWQKKELIIILNNDKMNLEQCLKYVSQYQEKIKVYQLPEKTTLGSCINFAVSKARYNYIAKFDDDDFYSPFYLDEAMHAFRTTEALVVGKRTVYTYFINSQELGIHHPGFEGKYVHSVRGATIVFNKRIYKNIQFPDLNRGEDGGFFLQCQKHGYKIFSTNKENFVCLRNDISKQTEKNDRLKEGCISIIKTKNYEKLVTSTK